MFKSKLPFFVLLPVLFVLILPTGSVLQMNRRASAVGAPDPEVAVPEPCTALQVTSAGMVCESRFGIVARLEFPEVDLKRALGGIEYLPQAQAVFRADDKTVDDKEYRNIVFTLRWEPATPEFLQIYLKEYLPYWGNQVPYRLFWNARYEECSNDDCAEWLVVNEKGEILPSDVKDLPSNLAADVNFNGVPAAFWNTKVSL